MNSFELIITAISLSMDAMAAALCQGISMKKKNPNQSLLIAGFFGGFQALMPLIGYFTGKKLSPFFMSFHKPIAFFILLLVGGKMLLESLCPKKESDLQDSLLITEHKNDIDLLNKNSCENLNSQLNLKSLTFLSIATSIDAFAVGISLAILKTKILSSILIIGITTFLISLLAVNLGYQFKNLLKINTEKIGGIALILLGIKILIF